ncbi:MAG: class I SAM-dependent rRNA methyltransferase [Candidatus Methylacidiphilales bacterium]|nr:class I SAM-dependent rRNA methyltransferase [Candidatus Methylacidiphilales bacterium]
MKAVLHLNRGVRHRILDGHPWVYASEVDRVEGAPEDGATIELRGPRGELLGSAIYNSRSQIVARRYSRQITPLDAPFIGNRLAAAVAFRDGMGVSPHARRIVWSESDGLPGLVVDQYGSVLVLQTLTLAMALRQDIIVRWLQENLRPTAILGRNDAPVRQLEGLPLERVTLAGEYKAPTPLPFYPGLTLDLNLWEGHKTGFYLDQLDNYDRTAAYAKGRRVLDCFCNCGAFGLAAMKAGAVSLLGIDQDAGAIAQAKALAQSALPDQAKTSIRFLADNVFDKLRELEKDRARFDLIILDPPSFTKTKAKVDAAMRGYKDIHLRALRILQPGGLLATFSCSHHIGEREWRGMLDEAACETGSTLRLRDRFTQSRDHPILTTVAETEYLRGTLLEKVE